MKVFALMPISDKNKFSHYQKIINLADADWDQADIYKLAGINASVIGINYLEDQYGRRFHHFCTTSYLGLEYHKEILAGAAQAIIDAGTLRIPNSKNRCKLTMLDVYENELSELFGATCLSTLSCSSASSGLLPLLASGALTRQAVPTLVFDRYAHYSMNHLKAACADETNVITAPHNDMNYLEDLCKNHKNLAYVADAVFSMGGVADLQSLLYLKERYGLFLYLDDSHSISAVGTGGTGYARSTFETLDDNILIVASLAKSFSASGGVIMFGSEKQKNMVHRYGGPSNWSQSLNAASIGAGMASIRIHRSAELGQLQQAMNNNIRLFDSLISTPEAGNLSAIRLIRCGEASLACKVASILASNGFLTSAVFFPVVPQGKAAIRITLRADMEASLIREFCALIVQTLLDYDVDLGST